MINLLGGGNYARTRLSASAGPIGNPRFAGEEPVNKPEAKAEPREQPAKVTEAPVEAPKASVKPVSDEKPVQATPTQPEKAPSQPTVQGKVSWLNRIKDGASRTMARAKGVFSKKSAQQAPVADAKAVAPKKSFKLDFKAMGAGLKGKINALGKSIRKKLTPDPKPQLAKSIYKDFVAQVKSGKVTWKIDQYDSPRNNILEASSFNCEILIDPEKIKGIEEFKMAPGALKDAQGNLKPVQVTIWPGRNPKTLFLQLNGVDLHYGRPQIGNPLGLIIPQLRNTTLRFRPSRAAGLDAKVNYMYNTLLDLGKQGKLEETPKAAKARAEQQVRIDRDKAAGAFTSQLAKAVKVVTKGHERLAQHRAQYFYRLAPLFAVPETLDKTLAEELKVPEGTPVKPLVLHEHLAKLLGLKTDKPVKLDEDVAKRFGAPVVRLMVVNEAEAKLLGVKPDAVTELQPLSESAVKFFGGGLDKTKPVQPSLTHDYGAWSLSLGNAQVASLFRPIHPLMARMGNHNPSELGFSEVVNKLLREKAVDKQEHPVEF